MAVVVLQHRHEGVADALPTSLRLTPEPRGVQQADRIAGRFGFRPTLHKLEIYGLCASCVASGAEAPSEGLTCPIESV